VGDTREEGGQLRELIGELLDRRSQLLRALDSRVVIEQAKGVLSERMAVSVDQAFRILRRAARSTRTKIHEVAREVVESPETPASILEAAAEVPAHPDSGETDAKRQSDVRIAENEALFRRVNEQLERVERVLDMDEPLQLMCECGDTDCADFVVVTRSEYEAVRADPERFIVLRGHDEPGVERIVEERECYLVVEKQGPAAVIARETNPRDG
jgi:hypothetical protein